MFTNYVLSIYVKRNNLIIFNILYNEIKRSFFVNLIKYNSDATTIAQYLLNKLLLI